MLNEGQSTYELMPILALSFIGSVNITENYGAMDKWQHFFMLLTFGRIIFAFIKTKKTNFIILISSIVLSLILFAVAKITSKPIFLSIIGLSMSIYFPCAMDYIAENFKGKLKTHLPMIMNIVTIKLIFMHYLAGRIEESFGAQSTLYLSVFFLIMASLTLVYHRSEKNKKCQGLSIFKLTLN